MLTPWAARWAMTRDTVSRQLWSSLRTWLRKPQMVVAGPNTRSRYLTWCSLSTPKMLASVRTPANGSPWFCANRARTVSKLVIEYPSVFRVGIGDVGWGALVVPTKRPRLFFAGRSPKEIDRGLGFPGPA